MSTTTQTSTSGTQRRGRLALVAAGTIGSAVLALGMTGTLSALTASITNSVNTAGMGSLAMTETLMSADGTTPTSTTCQTTASTTSATCSTINKYGGSMTMTSSGTGSSSQTTITIANTGTVDSSTFTLTSGACTLTANGNTGDLCSAAKVTITQDGTPVATNVAPSALGTITLTNVKANSSSKFVITISTAGLDNTVAGESISQPLTWTFNA